MKKSKRKLQLDRQTVRVLQTTSLPEVGGGLMVISVCSKDGSGCDITQFCGPTKTCDC